eukprot:CAMPEP_0179427386 /NCGR_PEP_ID=MMETSP0799-20121207/13352_1 /TAXON_ID=46947 /ORGANISM="Geminigera cryophila, Strain CCMP2564" /LENGTH=206 /DNA_ID=CAMNT_0021202417 /DNA_START=198 /DNA_END=819 /DNA_ORIENTATION=-
MAVEAACSESKSEEMQRLMSVMGEAPDPSKYRFKVGTPVFCFVGHGEWAKGRVVAHNYQQPAGVYNPYQVHLTDGSLIFAPMDDDGGIRLAFDSDCLWDGPGKGGGGGGRVYGHEDDDGHGHSHGHSHGGAPCEGHGDEHDGHRNSHGHSHGGEPCAGHSAEPEPEPEPVQQLTAIRILTLTRTGMSLALAMHTEHGGPQNKMRGS